MWRIATREVSHDRFTNPFASILPPAGAVLVDDWIDTQTPTPFRVFEGSRRIVECPHHDRDIDIYISGTLHHDGSVSRDVVVHELHADARGCGSTVDWG